MRVTAGYLERVACEWQRAYMECNDKPVAPAVEWKDGWFIIEGHRYRRAKVEMMTGVLRKIATQLPPQASTSGET